MLHIRTGILLLTLSSLPSSLGCLPASTSPMDGGGDTSALVTYTHDAQPIFMAKCSPCHSELGLGNHNIATTYTDALKPVDSPDAMGCWGAMDPTTGELSMPKKVGECALISINNGWMPMSAGCSANPPLDPNACLTMDQKSVIAAWVAAGMPQ